VLGELVGLEVREVSLLFKEMVSQCRYGKMIKAGSLRLEDENYFYVSRS
jgi:hypothetical protein